MKEYKLVIKALQQLAIITRSDIVFTIRKYNRYITNSTSKYLNAVKRIVKYLKSITHLKLRYKLYIYAASLNFKSGLVLIN